MCFRLGLEETAVGKRAGVGDGEDVFLTITQRRSGFYGGTATKERACEASGGGVG